MPIINKDTYKPCILFRNKHFNTIFSSLFRKTKLNYQRERIETKDHDFIDIDWIKTNNEKLLITIHGLESSSNSKNVVGIIKAILPIGFDAAAINLRGCSGTANRRLNYYHAGETSDLKNIINLIKKRDKYKSVILCGFSLGGNIILKYLGEMSDQLPEEISAAIAISSPCHLKSTAIKLEEKSNHIYINRFLKSLKNKMIRKKQILPDLIDIKNLNSINSFKDFDDKYTAPIHGFKNAEDYWKKCSSLFTLKKIKIPTLLINAKDDPMLAENSYPYKIAANSDYLNLLVTKYGGHCAYSKLKHNSIHWHEKKIKEFITSIY